MASADRLPLAWRGRRLLIRAVALAVLCALPLQAPARAQGGDVFGSQGQSERCHAVCGVEKWYHAHSEEWQAAGADCLPLLEQARATETTALAIYFSDQRSERLDEFNALIKRRTRELRAFTDCVNQSHGQQPPPLRSAGSFCRAIPQDEEQLGRYSPMGAGDIRQADPSLQYLAGLLKGYALCQEEQLRLAPITMGLALAAQRWKVAAQFASVFCKGASIAAITRDLMTRAKPGQSIYDVGIADGRLVCDTIVAAKAFKRQPAPTKETQPSTKPRPAKEPEPSRQTAAPGRGVWDLSLNKRGLAIEAAKGGNLPNGFPVIDRVAGPHSSPTEVTSIKSIDTVATHQAPGTLFSTLKSYIFALKNFTSATRKGLSVTAAQGTQRRLLVAIPPDPLSAQHTAEIGQAMQEAAASGITLDITTFP